MQNVALYPFNKITQGIIRFRDLTDFSVKVVIDFVLHQDSDAGQLIEDRRVTVITGHYPMTRTAVSKHLHILEEAGLLKERKVGRETRYSLVLGPLQDVQSWLVYFERFWDNKLNVLKHLVESPADDPVQD
ncbi:ArsR/SmtB family transcription factor [Paenibacillus monticola]|uniref:HTH arsR-type domain-containing protein n=1 Tax=Paenibacillus monticola TaxID=2666075 RepID=A0A7X2L1A7_9BACL|nr:helix-turn-helix transcriptional regulator [Paenibacillus monticola]MRN53199.1 hypothetical protein [Paenibacillus monticola]